MSRGWLPVAESSRITPDEPLGVELGDDYVAVFRAQGHLFAVEDTCPHARALLSVHGDVSGATVTCCVHGAAFDLASGRVLGGPADRGLRKYDVREVAGQVEIRRPAGE